MDIEKVAVVSLSAMGVMLALMFLLIAVATLMAPRAGC